MSTNSKSLYETDFYTWAKQQAELVRQRRFDELDLENLVEEVEDMGRSQYRNLRSRLAQLLMHLLKWQMQSVRDDLHDMHDWHTSWQKSIRKQRPAINLILKDNPGLKHELPDIYLAAYEAARSNAAAEMLCNSNQFPETCPWSFDEVMVDDFLPETPPH